MKILAIETSSIACSVALTINGITTSRFEVGAMQQTQMILPMIEKILADCKITLSELDAIAFGQGPGSFTGVRIATSVAQGLGFAADIPLIPVSSLAALAQTAYDNFGWKKSLVAVDARIQEVYWGAYQVNEEGLVELIGKEKVSTPQEIKPSFQKGSSYPESEAEEWYGVGNAWDVYCNQIPFQPGETATALLPSAQGIIPLSIAKFLKNEVIKADQAHPVYLRDEVAKKKNS